MAFMRVKKNSNYTVMSNYHLRDRNISLKAKGLLSLMLSLPEEWDFTLAGLAHISKEGVSAIRAAVIELEENGYVSRTRIRNEAGQLTDVEYTIYECPQSKSHSTDPPHALLQQPECDSPVLGKPILENPTLDHPTSEKQMQLNTKGISKDISITDLSNPYQSKDRIPSKGMDSSFPDDNPSYYMLTEKIKQQIDYWDLIERYDKDEIDNILAIMVETAFTRCDHFTIAGKQLPAELVHQRFRQIDAGKIEYVLECLHKCGSNIRNIKQYLFSTLFNAPATCESYYGAAVRHDLPYMRR